MENALKKIRPCPYHPETTAESLSVEGRTCKFVVCRICGATGPFGFGISEAIRRWNNEEKTGENQVDSIDRGK
ncbi:MAG: hypothetical protein PHD68_02200 [Rugosibacter sp.]|nr:hypothetical protein [Rugosibacter sp.]